MQLADKLRKWRDTTQRKYVTTRNIISSVISRQREVWIAINEAELLSFDNAIDSICLKCKFTNAMYEALCSHLCADNVPAEVYHDA